MIGYLIGSLRNPEIPRIAAQLREAGFEIVDDWFSAGPEADDIWQDYEENRGRNQAGALEGIHAQYTFKQDKDWLEKSDFAILALPAGKSAHLELGWILGQGKPAWVLFEQEPERFDLMYKFATGVVYSVEELIASIVRQAKAQSHKKIVLGAKLTSDDGYIQHHDWIPKIPEGTEIEVAQADGARG